MNKDDLSISEYLLTAVVVSSVIYGRLLKESMKYFLRRGDDRSRNHKHPSGRARRPSSTR
jgi:hypothetical protein